MKEEYQEFEFDFKKPANYKITVKGDVSEDWAGLFGEFEIIKQNRKDRNVISSIIGKIRDQAALSGILNMLYDKHMTVISVNIFSEDDNK